ncbi:transporter [Ganoderma sinense ZZ0214-1]|uniref:Transporter n=1 Tax=Ganoderma sinense ZZ0214-1 TaxID=1077348 RepID=A0A2G8SPL2_9APHY|nr:transporter [Ganoderma sinense ZZ0214-1]
MPPSYAPLPNPRYAPEDAQRELEDAFDSDDEGHDASENTPLAHTTQTARMPPPRADSHHAPLDADFPSPLPTPQTVPPGTYDFERDRDYDYPPPGSPPGPSARALPNDIGNSNGYVPTSPAWRPSRPAAPRLSFWRRAVGALLPQHYVRVPTDDVELSAPRVVGSGTENDGVFANVSAKPSRGIEVVDSNGEVHIVPEEVQKETPPSYAEAQADAVPPYWETTVHAPAAALDPNAYMIVDDLPSGPVFSFLMTAFVSYFFQFAGFVLTYLLHTTHAAKYGSRAGLGITLIQYGLIQYGNGLKANNSAVVDDQPTTLAEEILRWNTTRHHPRPMPTDVPLNMTDLAAYNATDPNNPMLDLDMQFAVTSRDWIALILMTLGWFLLLSSCVGFYRVKRWEASIRAASMPEEPVTEEQRAHDEQVRRNIEIAFGFADLNDASGDQQQQQQQQQRESQELSEAELRLTRTLQAAGLL